MNKPEVIGCRVQRRLIERGGSDWIAQQFDVSRMSEGCLRAAHGNVTWYVDGYDQHPDELYMIPVVRQFLAQWRKAMPTWLFFGSLATDSLRGMYVALLTNVVLIRRDPVEKCQVSYDPAELDRLIGEDLEVADQISARIGMTTAQRLQRACNVKAYFGFTA